MSLARFLSCGLLGMLGFSQTEIGQCQCFFFNFPLLELYLM